MTFNNDQNYWASINVTNEFITISTHSGLGRTRRDDYFPSHFLAPNSDNAEIGRLLLLALSNSRTIVNQDELAEFFDFEKTKITYLKWIDRLMQQYGYKTKRALFKNMRFCSVRLINNRITISHSYHEKLELWTGKGIDVNDYVVLSADSTEAEIGAGFRLALSRCID